MTVRGVTSVVVAELVKSLPGAVFAPFDVPSPAPQRYAVVWVSMSGKDRPRYSSGQVRDVYTVTVHCVGSDAAQAHWVQEKVNALTGVKLTLAGRKLWPVEYVTGQPAALDDDGDSPLVFAVSQFDVMSDPA
jgi:hypothetical protein